MEDVRATSNGPALDGASATGYRGFLFCDLRGYTRFVERHGDQAAADLLDRYRLLVRRAVGRFDGAEIRTEGDSFYVVFPSASKAVLCGLAIVAAARTAAADEPGQAIRVAVGIHAGEAVEGAEGFVGQAVNIAARVCVQAGPGEVLVTDTVRNLTRTTIAARFEARGRRQLKGINEPVFLFAAIGPDTPVSRLAAVRRLAAPLPAVLRILAVVVAGIIVLAVGLPRLSGGTGAPAASPSGAGTAGASLGGALQSAPPAGLISYVDTRTATVWLIDEHGGNRQQVDIFGVVTSAALSPDGRRLVYAVADAAAGRTAVEVIDVGAPAGTRLTDDVRFNDLAPAWSPDALAIVFARSPVDGAVGGLWVMNFDGTQLAALTDPESESHDQPSWSPDGSRIAFTVFGGGVETGTIAPDCSGYRSFGSHSMEDYGPVWSPDASRIAFTGVPEVDDATDVYTMNGAGRDLVNVSDHPASDHSPAWSPDGRRIAFVSDRSGAAEIWVANADGTEPRQLTSPTGQTYGRLSWSELPPAAAPSGGAGGPPLIPPAVSRPISPDCPARTP